MIDPTRHIYLASRSPRRRDLLRSLGVSFQVLLCNCGEEARPGEDGEAHVRRVSLDKLAAAQEQITERKLPRYPVLTGDTAIELAGELLGKPRDREHARQMLTQLSGRWHWVHTAISLGFGERVETVLTRTEVAFSVLSEDDIRRYVATGEPMDKAGGYAIQGKAAAFIPAIRGSYSGVVGLPLAETRALLRGFGIDTE